MENYHHGLPFKMPRGVMSSVPVSDTGGLGAKPGEAANFHFRFVIWDREFEICDFEFGIFDLQILSQPSSARKSSFVCRKSPAFVVTNSRLENLRFIRGNLVRRV